MRSFKIAGLAALALAAALSSASAWSHGRHHHHHRHGSLSLGVVFGGPLWYPPVYPAPVYYPPAVVVPAPRAYIERDAQVYETAPGYWYYCRESNIYYPYAKECAGPWERVPARPYTP